MTLLLLFSISNAMAATPPATFRLEVLGKKPVAISTQDLIRHKETGPLTLHYSVPYGEGRQSYLAAIPMAKLLKEWGANPAHVARFTCSDGYEVSIPVKKLMEDKPGRSRAVFVVQTPKENWGVIRSPSATEKREAGPFFLAWIRPGLSGITVEEWPYLVTGIQIGWAKR